MNSSQQTNPPVENDDISVPDMMARGAALHQEGELEAAEEMYRKVLEKERSNPDALHLLGLIADEMGYGQEAVEMIEEAIEEAPEQPLFHNHLAKVYLGLDDKENAERAYRKSLSLQPDNSDIKNDLANLLREKAEGAADPGLAEAVQLMHDAVDSNPDSKMYQVNLGNVLRDILQFDEAISCYDKAIGIDPRFVEAMSNKGLLLQIMEKYDEAEEILEEALAIDPDNAQTLNNLGNIYILKKKLKEADDAFSRAIDLSPEDPKILRNIGTVNIRLREDEKALDAFTKAIEVDSKNPINYGYFANVLRLMESYDAAEEMLNSSLKIFPDNPHLLVELAMIRQTHFRFEESEEILRSIIEIQPLYTSAYMLLAVNLVHTGTEKEVFECFDKVKELYLPDTNTLHLNYSLSLFSFGHLKEGWKYYKDRWKSERFPSRLRGFQQESWDGSSLEGKSIILYGEQGLGDEIRYASMIPDVLEKGGDIHIECAPRLVDLFQRSFPGTTVHAAHYVDAEEGKVHFDYQLPIVDLGEFFRPTIESYPSDRTSYLIPDADRVSFWRERFDSLGPNPKVGIIWRSGLGRGGEVNYWGAKIKELEPIFSTPGIDFVNLMYTECETERAEIKDLYGVELHTWDDIDLKDDQDDLAALISNLDLVISNPTAVAYLSGAVGVPTFMFVPIKNFFECLGHPDAPGWAPTLKYFRKEHNENWDETMQDMAAEMRARLGL